MKVPNNLGMLLLAIYLVAIGVLGIFSVNLGGLSILVPVLAAAAGICLLIGK